MTVTIILYAGLFALFVLFGYFVYKAVKEDNRVTMRDVAQVILLASYVYAMIKNGERSVEWKPFSDTFMFTVLGAISALAGLEYKSIKNGKNKHNLGS